MNKWLTGSKGSAAYDIVIFAGIIIFVLFPIFSAVFEKYTILCKGQIIKDALDMTNISTYTAINSGSLGKALISFDDPDAVSIYRSLLAKNLKLDSGLKPDGNSVAEDTVTIESLVCYTDGFPEICPAGKSIVRPTVHSCVIIPVRPALYGQVILDIMGKQYIELKVHVDTDIPVNN